MHKILLYIAFFLLSCNAAFSQTVSEQEKTIEKTTAAASEPPQANPLLLKKDYPANEKAAPEIIYVIDDKPVGREEYQQYINKKK